MEKTVSAEMKMELQSWEKTSDFKVTHVVLADMLDSVGQVCQVALLPNIDGVKVMAIRSGSQVCRWVRQPELKFLPSDNCFYFPGVWNFEVEAELSL